MDAPREWFAGFDLGEFLGLGLDTLQIGYLAGALFLALFGLSALRRVTRAPGPLPVLWIAIAIGLLAGAVLVAARGFPDQIPEELRPWTNPYRLLRAAAVLALIGCAVICLSAHWVRRPAVKLGFRLLGLTLIGVGIWLAAGWFADELPEETRLWAARHVVTRILICIGLAGIAGVVWVRPVEELPYRKWAVRAFAVAALGLSVTLAVRWFGHTVNLDISVPEVNRVTIVVTLIGMGTCALVALGAFLLRPKPTNRKSRSPVFANTGTQLPRATSRPLPVAVLLDDHGRPVLPSTTSGGPAGA